MKKFIFFAAAILFLVFVNRTKILDTAVYEDIEVKILSSNKKYGDEIYIKNKDKNFKINVEGMNPWKLQFCNVDGGEVELAIGVYKESERHKEKARRPFIYNIDFENERLKPKLRISRLNNPMVDFLMYDIDGDGFDEIISIEENLYGNYEFGGYNWTSFSFTKDYCSVELENLPKFNAKDNKVIIDGMEKKLFLKGEEIVWK